MIDGDVRHSVIFSNVEIGEGSKISDCVIMPDAKIGKNVKMQKTLVGPGAVVEDGAVLGLNEDAGSKYISGMCTHGSDRGRRKGFRKRRYSKRLYGRG